MKHFLNGIYKSLIMAIACCIIAQITIAQNVSADSIQQQFNAYQLNNFNEKIFVHIDKTFFITGESIWFKVYCVDESFHRPSLISRIAYVEIINGENKAVLQAKIGIDSGSGNGSFIIPSFVASGNYRLRAYTKWMENFSADYFFEQPLTIINNSKLTGAQMPVKPKQYNISFFPEGGNLVEGFTSEIAFKVIDEYGSPVDCNGTIVDGTGSTVASFQSLKFGMGNFSLIPKVGSNYSARIKVNDTTIEQQLPKAYSQGYVMHAENINDDQIKITVSTNVPNEFICYFLAHSQNVLKDYQQKRLSASEVTFIIDKNKLADGISSFTIFNSDKQPVCERLYFKQPLSKLNINISADKTVYGLRQPVDIAVNASTNAGSSNADMSVAVFMLDSLQHSDYTDIFADLFLTSELKGNITSPGYYFQNNNEAAQAADNLMLTQGWRRFKWDDVLQNKKPYFEFLPEHEGFIIDGKINNRYNSNPAVNTAVMLTVPGENFQLATTVSDANGNLQFNVKKFYGGNNIILQADSNYKPEINSPFANIDAAALPAFKIPLQFKSQLLFRSINTQADNAFLIDAKQHAYSYNSEDTSLFYGTPDKRYYLDDYTRFITMEEVMREYVAEVKTRKEAGQFHFKVLNFLTKTYFDDDPLVLLDGVPVSNISNIIDFDPLKIKRLDVIAGRYYYGSMVNDGIVSYTTYKGDLAGFTLNANDVIINYDGLQQEREFYSPVYDNNNKLNQHLPDVRNVLYWSPKIKTSANGKTNFNFYTSDLPGKYVCIIQGISPAGIAGSNIISFDVSK